MCYLFLLLLVGVPILGQEKVDSFIVHQPKENTQYGSNIRKAEISLNKNITKANLSLSEYASLLTKKIGSLPHRTILSKGITKGDDCVLHKIPKDDGDCLKLEQFDFIEGEKGEASGSRSKSMILFFSGAIYKKEDNGDFAIRLIKIKSRIFTHNLSTLDKKLIEVIDTDPLGNPDHDDKIFITSQTDPAFASSHRDALDNLTPRTYLLSTLENSRSNPLRNQFKREAYLKHLMAFEKIFSKANDYNDSKESDKKEITKKTLKN